MGPARPLAQGDQLVGGLLDAEPLGQEGGQQQAGVGDGRLNGRPTAASGSW
jgi:hypothetical protein